MLKVTEAAKSHLGRLLEQAGADDETCIRLSSDGKELSMQMSKERPDDLVFQHAGETVLVVDQPLADVLSKRTLDTTGAQEDVRLALT